jgi:hypothetical protein
MERRYRILPTVFALAVLFAGLSGCQKEDSREAEGTPEAPGSLIFTANGEDFVRQGFVDKQGWSISFDNLYVNIVDPTAYAPGGQKQVVLEGSHWVDLAEGEASAQPVVLGVVDGVTPANYQSLRFALKRAAAGPYAGASVVMIGSAERGTTRVPFTVRLDEEMLFDGREGYVGDEIKGLLQPGGTADVEMTFHFDHVFGDIEAAEGDHVNTGSVGFDFFHAFAEQGVVDVSQRELAGAGEYRTLVHALWSLGHLGEGHCDVSEQSSRQLL